MNLIFLTKYYPFGADEAFIENEISVMCRNFEKVCIIACEVPADETRKRELPENCVAVRINSGANARKQKVQDSVHSISVLRSRDFVDEMNNTKGIPQKAFVRYFESKSQRIFERIKRSKTFRTFIKNDYVLYSYWFFVTARIGTMISRIAPPVYMFMRAHRYDLYEERNRLNFLPYREALIRKYDMVFPCSYDGEQYLQAKYPKYKDKIKASYLGTLDHGINPPAEDDVFKMVSCSRVEPVKRVKRIAEAMAELAGKYNIEWVHIGDGSEFDQLESYIRKNKITDQCILKGQMQNADVMELYRQSHFDLFINVSSSEGLPVSVMEAMSFGIPVIATDVGGTSEIVNTETGALLQENFKREELVSAIREMIEQPELREKKRNASRARWESYFQAIDNYEGLYTIIAEEVKKKTDF